MTHRSTPVIALAAALASALALTGCSTSGPDSARSSATASASAESVVVGTIDPPAGIEGLEALGLSKATLSVETEPHLSNYSESGLTYVEPRTDPAADLVVHHVAWDGTEQWTGTVPVPAEGDPSLHTPVLSYDDSLGLVSYWFTTDTWEESDSSARSRTHRLSSPVHWFDTATGQGGSEEITPDQGLVPMSASTLVGAISVNEQTGQGSAVTWMDSAHTFQHRTFGELGGQDGQNVNIRPWQGSMVVMTKDSPDGTESLLVDGTEVVSDLGPEASVWVLPGHYLALDASSSRLLSITRAGAEPLDLQGCPVSLDGGLAGSSTNGYTYIGQYLISPDQSSSCQSEAIGSGTETINGVLSDGSLLIRSASGDTYTHRLRTAEGASVDLPQGSVFDPRGGHLVYTVPGDGVSTVTAFSEEDLEVQGS